MPVYFFFTRKAQFMQNTILLRFIINFQNASPIHILTISDLSDGIYNKFFYISINEKKTVSIQQQSVTQYRPVRHQFLLLTCKLKDKEFIMLPVNETTFHTQMWFFFSKGNTTVHLHKLIQTIYVFDNGKPHTDCLLLVYILEFFMLACNTALAVKGLTWTLNKWL